MGCLLTKIGHHGLNLIMNFRITTKLVEILFILSVYGCCFRDKIFPAVLVTFVYAKSRGYFVCCTQLQFTFISFTFIHYLLTHTHTLSVLLCVIGLLLLEMDLYWCINCSGKSNANCGMEWGEPTQPIIKLRVCTPNIRIFLQWVCKLINWLLSCMTLFIGAKKLINIY